MPQEFEGDLAEAVFWGADLHGATFRDVDLTGTRISHALVVDVEIDAIVDRVVINGVDVTDFVNQHDRWYPLRSMLRPTTPDEARAGWTALDAEWATAIARARTLPDDRLQQSVDGEFSFVETLRHLVFAIDKWFTVPVLGATFEPMGLPNRGSLDFGFPGLDHDVAPTVDVALAAFADRRSRFADRLSTLVAVDLDIEVEVLENGTNPLRECIFTVLEEGFWHLRYALRDLATLGLA